MEDGAGPALLKVKMRLLPSDTCDTSTDSCASPMAASPELLFVMLEKPNGIAYAFVTTAVHNKIPSKISVSRIDFFIALVSL